jgi:hypothetical protein
MTSTMFAFWLYFSFLNCEPLFEMHSQQIEVSYKSALILNYLRGVSLLRVTQLKNVVLKQLKVCGPKDHSILNLHFK